MVRGMACLSTWPMWKSSKKLPPPVFDICPPDHSSAGPTEPCSANHCSSSSDTACLRNLRCGVGGLGTQNDRAARICYRPLNCRSTYAQLQKLGHVDRSHP